MMFVRNYILAAILLACTGLSAAAAPRTIRDCPDVCPELAVIPAGSFTMGGTPNEEGWSKQEAPRHPVRIARELAVGKYDVTFDQWNACVADLGCDAFTPFDYNFGRATRPVIGVSWDDAQSYVAWLSHKTGKTYRLLSEAEWEYAARAGTTTAYYWGNAIGSGKANCFGCGSPWDKKTTSPVGSFTPNAFGLYDMAGNVSQWTQDCWNPDYNGASTDGGALATGDCSQHVVRGGSWFVRPPTLRSGFRRQVPADSRDDIFSFRVARVME